MNLGSWMISVCLFTSVGVQAQQTTTTQDKSQGQAQRSIIADPEMPRGATDAGPAQNVAVPRLVKFSSTAKDQLGHSPAGVVGVTFAIYKEQEGGAALWMETQNVQLDEQGHYAVLLGATKNDGLPVELFAAAEPRWLGVQLNLPGEVEQPRVLLVSVPYALKAADAESLGGIPASSYALAPTGIATGTDNGGTGGSAPSTGTQAGTGKKSTRAGATPAVVTTNFIPMFTDNAGTLGNSLLVQGAGANATVQFDVNGGVRGTGLATAGRSVAPDAINTNALFLNGSNAMGVIGASNAVFAPGALFTKTSFYSGGLERMTVDGTTGNVGIGNLTPAAKLDVNGNISSNGTLTLQPLGTATAGGGFSSGPLSLAASSFNSGIGVPVSQTFQWQAQPVGNNTSGASGQLSLLYGSGANVPSATGLSLASNGMVTAPSFTGNGSGLTNIAGHILTVLLGNTGAPAATGYFNLVTNYVPPVNARALTFMRCSMAGSAAGQALIFRSAIRNPTGGTVTIGNAFYLTVSTAGTESVFNENNDFFDLTAGQSYDFGMNFVAIPGGSGVCSALVVVMQN
jgi:hypothetical protein